MKVLVIGGAGFIGRRVVQSLARKGHDVVSGDLQPLPDDVLSAAVASTRLDIADFEQVVSCMATHRPDVVVNLSYMRDTTPRAAFRVNVLGMDNCFEAARISGVKHVVYSSSIAVNGRQAPYGPKAILETDSPFPLTQYANHKVFNEYQASEYRKKHDMRITGLRAAHISGRDKLIGSVDHVLCIVRAAQNEKVILEHADQMRCVVYVDDIAEVFVALALSENTQHPIYNSGGQTVSLTDIADMVRLKLPNAEISFRNQTGGEQISTAYRFDNSRLQNEFGIQYPPYEQRVAQMIDEIRAKADNCPNPSKIEESANAVA
jgi:nucleoside-diphosphate-sugar epimerase